MKASALLPERVDHTGEHCWLCRRLKGAREAAHLWDGHRPLSHLLQVVQSNTISICPCMVAGDLSHGLPLAVKIPLDELQALVEDVDVVLSHLLQISELLRVVQVFVSRGWHGLPPGNERSVVLRLRGLLCREL